MPRIKITKTAVDALPSTERGQVHYMDTTLPGFGVYVGRNSKTYFVQRDVSGRTVRRTIGKHGVFTAEEARHEARQLLNQLARGIDPKRSLQRRQTMALTLRQAWQQFQAARALRPQSVKDYARAIDRGFSDWLDRPLAEISGEQVIQRYTADLVKLGGSSAARKMRIFRAIYNFAMVANEDDLPPNPTVRLSKLRMWHRDLRRRTYIRPADLPAWYAAVMALESDSARDYLRLVLFTGMRRAEAMALRWGDVDLAGRTLTVPQTKNGDPLVLPLSSFLLEMLAERRRCYPDAEWVFPGNSKSGHLQEPKKWIHAVVEASGVQFSLHDLRRTFITVAESLDLSMYTLKRLLNHRDGRDVTAGYIVLDVERLRKPMQRIADYLLSAIAQRSNTLEHIPNISAFTAHS